MAGMTCALAMIPEAVSFAFVAGVSPLCGLWTTVVMGAAVALGGGRGGVMTGASGACAVVVAELVREHGVEFLGPTVLLAGMLQIFVGKAKVRADNERVLDATSNADTSVHSVATTNLTTFSNVMDSPLFATRFARRLFHSVQSGKFIRLVPYPVMLGFVNGLAIVIAKAQFSHFKDPTTGAYFDLTSPKGMTMAGLTATTAFLIKTTPRITDKLPASLFSIIFVTLASTVLKLPATTLADLAGKDTFAGGWSVLPKLGLPSVPTNLSTLQKVFPFALTMSAVGLVESLLTLQVRSNEERSDELTGRAYVLLTSGSDTFKRTSLLTTPPPFLTPKTKTSHATRFARRSSSTTSSPTAPRVPLPARAPPWA